MKVINQKLANMIHLPGEFEQKKKALPTPKEIVELLYVKVPNEFKDIV